MVAIRCRPTVAARARVRPVPRSPRRLAAPSGAAQPRAARRRDSSNRRSTYSMSRHPLVQRRREIQVRLQPFDELLVAQVHQRRVARRAARRRRARSTRRSARARRSSAVVRRATRAAAPRDAPGRRRRPPAVPGADARPSMIGRSNSRVVRAVLVDDRAPRVDRGTARRRCGRSPSAHAR